MLLLSYGWKLREFNYSMYLGLEYCIKAVEFYIGGQFRICITGDCMGCRLCSCVCRQPVWLQLWFSSARDACPLVPAIGSSYTVHIATQCPNVHLSFRMKDCTISKSKLRMPERLVCHLRSAWQSLLGSRQGTCFTKGPQFVWGTPSSTRGQGSDPPQLNVGVTIVQYKMIKRASERRQGTYFTWDYGNQK